MIELLVTIDTEPDCDPGWNRSDPLEFSSVTEGIPGLLRPIWDRYGVSPLYFVTPEVVRDDECVHVLKREISLGAEIGTHLHSEFIEPDLTAPDPAGKKSDLFPCYAHSTEIEREKIRNLTELIERRLGVRPQWYRAARYGADMDTMRSLVSLGYRFDSSVTPGISWRHIGGPDHRQSPMQPYWIARDDYYAAAGEGDGIGIREYPITIMGRRFGWMGGLLPDSWLFYRWLRPTHMTVFEQKRMVRQIVREYVEPVLVMMFHSMEVMIDKTPFVRNRLMQRRFLGNLERMVQYISRSNGSL